jgi:multidrug efflux pump subunit AcrA (membrane-fusion protein)
VTATRLLTVLCAGAALLIGGFGLASCGGDDDAGAPEPTRTQPTIPTTTDTTTTTTTTTTEVDQPTFVRVRVVGGVPKGGIVRTTVQKGDRVVLVVTSDVGDHVHLHGYDIMRDVAAGGTARIRFRATLPGRFEVELEDRGVPIADLTVEP